MNRRYWLIYGVVISMVLLIIATVIYPGGSHANAAANGFDWENNYLCNLFAPKAINGADNTSRIWAISGWCLLCACYVAVFISFSKKIPAKGASNIIRYCGIGAMVFAFMAVTPYHDIMVTIADTLGLLSAFYIMVFTLRTRLHLLKVLSILVLLLSYAMTYIYYSQQLLEILPTVQKVGIVVDAAWILALEYGSSAEDFQLKKPYSVYKLLIMEALLRFIHAMTDFSEESWIRLQPALSIQQFKKNEFLLREGDICKSLFFIEKGYCRSFYEIDGIEKNTAFYLEDDIATNIRSFGSGERSAASIIACEPITTVIFDKVLLFEVAKQTPEIEALGRNCIRLFAARQDEFAILFNIYSAKDRLAYIEEKHPRLLQRVSQTQLASFLGVARETLSRIRKRRVS